MRVLIVSFWFPPANVVGAVRTGKLAGYLDRRGHDVRALAADVSEDRSLTVEIPQRQIVYAEYRDRRDWAGFLIRRSRHPARATSASDMAEPVAAALPVTRAARADRWETLRRTYRGLVCIPDLRAPWLKTAVPAGRRMIAEWRPDIIFASAPPSTTLIGASRLSRAFRIPWVADLRDLWAANPYYPFPEWRRSIDKILERRTLRTAAAIVTTSKSFARTLRSVHRNRIEVVLNGYVEEDFPQVPVADDPNAPLTIRYTGVVSQFRDPSPLFEALAMLEPELRRQIRVEFFGASGAAVAEWAARYGVSEHVFCYPRVPHRSALELQLQADVLLLLQWNDERDEGSIPAKLFEYFFTRRPILFIGYERSVPAELIRERNAGTVSNTPGHIRDLLRGWLEEKRSRRLARLDPSVSLGLSRDEQFQSLERLFAEVIRDSSR